MPGSNCRHEIELRGEVWAGDRNLGIVSRWYLKPPGQTSPRGGEVQERSPGTF